MSLSKLFVVIKSAFLPLLVLLVAIGGFIFLKSTKPTQPPVEIKQKVWPVKAMSIQLQRLSPMQTLYGSIESNALVTASAPVSGQVAQIWVKDGVEFKMGEPLVALSDSDLQIPYQMAKADVEDVEAQLALEALANQANQQRLLNEEKVLALKQKDVERNSQLITKDLSSQSVLDQSKEALVRQEYTVVGAKLAVQQHQLNLQQLGARLAKAKANLEQAKINLKRGQLIAPFNGRVAQVKVAAGDRVAIGSPLMSYYAYQSLELKAKLPVDALPGVYDSLAKGQPLKALYRVNQTSYELPLLRLAGQASSNGVDAYFGVPEELKMTRPGDLWQVQLVNEPQEGVFAVPYSAIYGANSIYVVEKGLLEIKTLQNLGETQVGQETFVLLKDPQGAIADGTQVLVTHLPNAITGLKVSVVE